MHKFLCQERLILIYLGIIYFGKKKQIQNIWEQSLITLFLHFNPFFDGLDGWAQSLHVDTMKYIEHKKEIQCIETKYNDYYPCLNTWLLSTLFINVGKLLYSRICRWLFKNNH